MSLSQLENLFKQNSKLDGTRIEQWIFHALSAQKDLYKSFDSKTDLENYFLLYLHKSIYGRTKTDELKLDPLLLYHHYNKSESLDPELSQSVEKHLLATMVKQHQSMIGDGKNTRVELRKNLENFLTKNRTKIKASTSTKLTGVYKILCDFDTYPTQSIEEAAPEISVPNSSSTHNTLDHLTLLDSLNKEKEYQKIFLDLLNTLEQHLGKHPSQKPDLSKLISEQSKNHEIIAMNYGEYNINNSHTYAHILESVDATKNTSIKNLYLKKLFSIGYFLDMIEEIKSTRYGMQDFETEIKKFLQEKKGFKNFHEYNSLDELNKFKTNPEYIELIQFINKLKAKIIDNNLNVNFSDESPEMQDVDQIDQNSLVLNFDEVNVSTNYSTINNLVRWISFKASETAFEFMQDLYTMKYKLSSEEATGQLLRHAANPPIINQDRVFVAEAAILGKALEAASKGSIIEPFQKDANMLDITFIQSKDDDDDNYSPWVESPSDPSAVLSR
jgi:hypothetical protein